MNRNRGRPVAVAVLLFGGLAGCSTPGSGPATDAAGTVTVFAASSLRAPLEELAESFSSTHPGTRVRFNFAGSTDLVGQLREGAPADLLATADEETMELAISESLLAGAAHVIASNHLILAVPAGNPAGIEALAEAAEPGGRLVACAPDVPCGRLAHEVARAAGVSLAPVSEESSVSEVVAKVISGEADAGLVYASDVVATAGQLQAFEIPQAHALPNNYPVGLTKQGSTNPAAADFLELLLSPTGQRALVDAGFAVASTR